MFRPDQQIGPYTLVRELGGGTFGVVWLAERRATLATTQVAVKLPKSDEPDVDAITKEARLWVQASGHPNVLPVIEAEVYDGFVVIVSEYAPDGALSTWLQRHGRRAPSIETAVTMCSGILAGLAHLHSRQLVHRDLKPGNILLQGETPRIADFGLARVLRASVQTYGVAGTPAYMAPEAWDGDRSERTDLWSIGVILYEMLAGNRPFREADINLLRTAIQRDAPIPLPDQTPRALRDLIIRALEKDAANRYQSANEMLSDLRALTSQGPPSTRGQATDISDNSNQSITTVAFKRPSFSPDEALYTEWQYIRRLSATPEGQRVLALTEDAGPTLHRAPIFFAAD